MNRIQKSLFFRYLYEQRKWLLWGSLCGLVMNTSVVLPPLVLGRIIDAMGAYNPMVGPAQVMHLLLLYLGSMLLYNVPRFGKRLWFRVTANGLNSRLKEDLLAAVFTYPMPQYEREKIGDIMSRAIGDVQSLSDTVQVTVTEVFDTAVMMVSSFVMLMLLRPGLTLAASLPVPFAVWLARWMGPRIFARARLVRESSSTMSQHLQQDVSGVRVLRLLGRERAETSRFETISRSLRERTVGLALLQGGVMPLYTICASMGVVLVIGWGANDILRGAWTVGLFTSYLTMFVNMAVRTLQGANVINRVYVGAAAWHRIEDKLQAAAGGYPPESFDASGEDDSTQPEALSVRTTKLQVSFGDGEAPVLADVELDIPAGSWVGITGPVGCGKSALGLVLSGLYPYSGSLMVGGKELSTMTHAERVKSIAYMGENPFLFSTSVAENISFSSARTDPDAILHAAEAAALPEDIERLDDGYETAVGEAGVRVSGGQRQRIAIARTIYAGTPVVVLDEPFSAVDIPTERELVKRLRTALSGRTVLIMSHRLMSFVHADQVIVLDHGRVLEAGSHDSLIKDGGVYARIFAAQKWMEANEP